MEKFRNLEKSAQIFWAVALAVLALLIINIATGNRSAEAAADEVADAAAVTTAAVTEEPATAVPTTAAAEAVKTVELVNGVWTYTVNGVPDLTYNGIAENAAGKWVVQNGVVDFSYNGQYADGAAVLDVVNSRVE